MSFRLKTILGVAAIEAILLTLLVSSGLHYIAESTQREFTQRAIATIKSFAVTSKDAVLSTDLASLESFVSEVLNYPGVLYARVRDADGRVLAEDGESQYLRSPFRADADLGAVDDEVFDTFAEIKEADTLFGRVEVGLSMAALRTVLAEAKHYGTLLALLEMLLVALFSFALGQYLTRQLTRLTQASERIAAGDLGYQVEVRGADELAQTARAFNLMSSRVQTSYNQLAASEQDLRAILDNIQEGIITTDARGTIQSASPATAAIFARQQSELLGGSMLDLLVDREGEPWVALFEDGPQESLGRSLEGRGRLPDGSEFPIEVTFTAMQRGDARHFVVVVRNISERRQAELALAGREAYLRGVLNATHDGIIVIDNHGSIDSFNAGAEAMFGYRSDEVVGQNVSMLLPSPHRERHDEYLRRYRETGRSVVLGVEREFDAGRKDGSAVPIALRIHEVTVNNRHLVIGVVHDITARKQTEDALRRAKEAAEQAAEAKSQFLANMSHEIRTPMQGVLGALEMLKDTALSPAQTRYAETASVSAEVLLTVIDEILEFSRLESGKLRIESIEFDLRRSVEDVAAILGQRAHSKQLELACFIDPDVPLLLRGDPIRLRQILINLVGNAIKFTDQGEVVVNVTVRERPDRQVRLLFEVRDTGIGIAGEEQARLFDAFTQADGSTRRRFGGTGLGLSIAKRLVELMNGEIGVQSEPDKGSRFWFELPFGTAFQRSGERSGDFRGKRILIVDDNATNRIILHRYLTAWRVQPGSAADGDEALAAIQNAALAGHPYHLILLDLNMPGMDGVTLVKALRDDPQLASTRVIMLSSSGYDEATAANLAIDVWMTKPVRQSDLQDAISTVFNRTPVCDDQPYPAAIDPPPFAGERVLLVEDNPVSQDLGAEMLRRRGLSVDLASNGAEALAAIERTEYDLVLMDVQMPEIDGYEATRRIRERELSQPSTRLPIIALTAHALPSDRQQCLAAGMDDYLVKPYNTDSLSTLIARWLPPPGQQDRKPAPRSPTEILDRDKIEEIRRIMGPRFSDLLGRFTDSVRSQLARIREEGRAGDRDTAFEAVHSLKNTAGDLGARSLHLAAQAMERSMRSGGDWQQLVPELEAIGQLAIEAAQTISEREGK